MLLATRLSTPAISDCRLSRYTLRSQPRILREMLFALKSPLLLYPFRYFDTVRKRWIRARYVAERHEIAETLRRVGNHRTAGDSFA